MMYTTRVLLALVLFGVLLPRSGFAQDEEATREARNLYEAGASAFGDGRFEDALSRWEEAYALTELPALRYNIGTAHDRLGHPAEALAHYESYLEATPEAENRNYVVRRIGVLRAQVADAEAAASAAAAAAAAEEAAEREAAITQESPAGDGPTNAAASGGGISVPGLVLGAGGAALLVAGLATGLVASSRYSDLEAECSMGICDEAQEANISGLRRLALTTDVLLAVGGAATLAGVIWMIVGSGGDDDDSRVRIDFGHDRVVVGGTF